MPLELFKISDVLSVRIMLLYRDTLKWVALTLPNRTRLSSVPRREYTATLALNLLKQDHEYEWVALISLSSLLNKSYFHAMLWLDLGVWGGEGVLKELGHFLWEKEKRQNREASLNYNLEHNIENSHLV